MKEPLKVLELFAGSCSISKTAKIEFGAHCFSSDLLPFVGVDYICDIVDFELSRIPFSPDIIWASPPCTSFSIAAISHHWTRNNKPKSDRAREAYGILNKVYEIFAAFPNAKWYMENPVGKLRKHPLINQFAKLPGFNRHTVTYCQYGDSRRKPTDIWTNDTQWISKKQCSNGDTCHEAAPRGSKTGTQGLKNAYERSVIPHELCKEILTSAML